MTAPDTPLFVKTHDFLLAIVSGRVDDFATRLVDPEFVKTTGGGEISWSIATKITCPDKTVAKREFWPRVRDELFAAEWDLLLCSAGSLSAVICEAVRQRGRRAIDVGSMDLNLAQGHDFG